MILLDTDHVNVLKYPEHHRFARLTTQLNTSSVTTIHSLGRSMQL
ncbi:MAG TPA: hypothetical protein VI542_03150 [Candidatus Tectomicrobia bacterium]